MALSTLSMAPKNKAAKKAVKKEEPKKEVVAEAKPKKEGKLVRYKDKRGVYAWKVE